MAATPASEHARDTVTGARILTGEMLAWSDLGRVATPLALRPILDEVVRTREPRRTLLVGPRAAMLVDALPPSASVDVLVRSMPDSRVVSDDAGLHDRAHLLVGGLDALDADARYDLVVGLGGPGRLLGPDSLGMGEVEVLDSLVDRLAPGGTILVDVANELGLHEFIAAQPLLDEDSDDAWHVGADGFDHRHLHLTDVTDVVRRRDLSTDVLFAGFPSLDRHHLLIDGAAADDAAVRASARVHGCRAIERHFRDIPSLRDPRATLERVIDAGLVTEMAPAWVLVAHLGAEAPALELPALIDAETWVDPAWGRINLVDRTGAMRAVWAGGITDDEVNEGAITRDLAASSSTGGRILEMELRDACARRSHTDIRSLITTYHSWLHDPTVWTRATAERRGFATIDNVVITSDGTLGVVDPSWRRAGVLGADDMFVFGLRQFATRLLASAAPHPWKTSTTPHELTAALAAMVGTVVTTDVLRRVVRVHSEMASVISPSDVPLADLIETTYEQGDFPRNLPSATATGFRELLGHDRMRSRRLREHDGQVAWLEGTLRHRDRYIRELERIIERYEETLTYKTVQAIRAPRRIATQKAVATAKSTANDVLPPDFMSKARRLARRAVT